ERGGRVSDRSRDPPRRWPGGVEPLPAEADPRRVPARARGDRMRSHAVGLIAARELREAMRSRWFVLAAACFLVLSLGLSMLGLAGAQRSGLAGFDRTTASLLNLALVFVPLVTLTLGGLSIAGELEDQSLALLLAQPVTRLEVFAGKYFG